jgi:hypothetical protein
MLGRIISAKWPNKTTDAQQWANNRRGAPFLGPLLVGLFKGSGRAAAGRRTPFRDARLESARPAGREKGNGRMHAADAVPLDDRYPVRVLR